MDRNFQFNEPVHDETVHGVLPNGFAENGPQGFQTRVVVPNSDEEREILERLARDPPSCRITVSVPATKVEYDIVSDTVTVRMPEERYRRLLAARDDLDAALKYGAQVDALLAAATEENANLRAELAQAKQVICQLTPETSTGGQSVNRTDDNPLARRFRGGVGQAFEDRS